MPSLGGRVPVVPCLGTAPARQTGAPQSVVRGIAPGLTLWVGMVGLDLPGYESSTMTWILLAGAVLLAIVVGERLAALAQVPRAAMTVWLIAIGGYIAATVPAASGASSAGIECRWLSHPLSPGVDLTDAHQILNALIMVPIGLLPFASSVRWKPRTIGLSVGAVLPVLVEGLQAVLPASRSCDAVDVVDGWIGLAAGAFTGAILFICVRRLRGRS